VAWGGSGEFCQFAGGGVIGDLSERVRFRCVLGVGSKPAPLKAKGAAPGVENVRSSHGPSAAQPGRWGSAEEKQAASVGSQVLLSVCLEFDLNPHP
jgi:hypothetical protein